MHIVHVHVHVKLGFVEAFKQATIENARGSIQEPGIARFDVFQHADDPTRFLLIEHYRMPDDQLKHRDTAHYVKWRDAVAEMMAEPHTPYKYVLIYPEA
jgi:quinol monooxygenase YgiN